MKSYFIALMQLALFAFSQSMLAADKLTPIAVITQPYIELHTGPGRGYPIFHVVERGDKVELLKRRTHWIKVRTMPHGPMHTDRKGNPIPGTNTREGWVYIDDIAATQDETGNSIADSQPLFEDYTEHHWEAGIMLGELDGTDLISSYIGYRLTPNLSVEVEVSENFGNFSSGNYWTATVVHQLFPDWRFSPFFLLGGGEYETNPRSTIVAAEGRNDALLTAGAGMRIRLNQQFFLRVQYRDNTILTDRDDDLRIDEWKIGISALFY